MPISSRLVAVVTAALTSAGLASCATTETTSSQGEQDNTFTYAIDQTPDFLNPVMQDEHTDPVTELVFRGLVGHDADNGIVAAMASDWLVTPDGLTYTFTLRPDITWQDGEPFSSADVKFTLDAVRDQESGAATGKYFAAVRSIETPDPETVVIQLDQPTPALLDSLTMGILPEHLLAGKSITDQGFSEQPVGTGPFRLTEYKPDQYAQLEAFDGFYGGRPELDTIIIKYVPDATARLLQLTNGEVDGAFVEPQQATNVENDDSLRLEVYPTADYRALMFNMLQPKFADPLVRQALNFAVDREALVDAVLVGYGEPATSPLGESPFEVPGLAPYTLDPDQVATLMSQAGYSRDGDGPWTKDGQPMAFSISTFAEDPLRVGLLDVVTTQLNEQGFQVIADPKPRDYVVDHWADLDAFVIGWGTPYYPDTSLSGPFDSSQALALGGSNLSSYSDPAVDEALQAGRRAVGEQAQQDAYAAFQRAIIENPPYAWLAYLQTLNAFPANFAGPTQRTLEHHGYGLFWNVETWHWT